MSNNDCSRDAAISIEKRSWGYVMRLSFEIVTGDAVEKKGTFIEITAFEALQTAAALGIKIIE